LAWSFDVVNPKSTCRVLVRAVRAGHRGELGLVGRDPELHPRQALVVDDVGAPAGYLVAGVGVDDLVIGPHEVDELAQVLDAGGRRGTRITEPWTDPPVVACQNGLGAMPAIQYVDGLLKWGVSMSKSGDDR